jgi:hypothetical protein
MMPCLAFLAGISAAHLQAEPSVERTVQALLEEHFPDMNSTERTRVAERLSQIIRQVPGTEWRKAILKELPQALDYHAFVIREAMEALEPSDRSKLSDLLQQGYSLHLEYLVARVQKAAGSEPSEDHVRQMSEQVETIVVAARETLRQKLPGASSAAYMERALRPLREEALGSLRSPLHSFIDRPLSAAELQDTIEAIRNAAEPFTPVLLEEEDFLRGEKIKFLGVSKLINRVMEACYTASHACFNDFNAFERRHEEWTQAVRVRRKTLETESSDFGEAERTVPPTGKIRSPSNPPFRPLSAVGAESGGSPETASLQKESQQAPLTEPRRPLRQPVLLLWMVVAVVTFAVVFWQRRRIH